MAKEPEDHEVLSFDVAPLAASLQADAIPTFQYAEDPAPVTPAPWELELGTFWQNVLANVSAKVETPIHNFLREETEALKARLKAVL